MGPRASNRLQAKSVAMQYRSYQERPNGTKPRKLPSCTEVYTRRPGSDEGSLQIGQLEVSVAFDPDQRDPSFLSD
jgi:hypothetical protein